MSLKLENEKNNFCNIIMEINMIQKKKHLLLLNRIMRTELKKDIIKTPSKLTEEEVDKYFNRLFIKKGEYYVPIKSKIEIKIDEELFKNLIKKPKKKEVKEVEKPKEEVKEVEKPKEEVKEVEKTKEEQIKEFYNIFDLYNYDYIYDNLSIIYNSLKTKDSIPFKNLKYRYNEDKFKVFDEFSYKKNILKQLLTIKKLNVFLNQMKNYKQKKDEVEKTKEYEKNKKDKEETIKKFNKIFKSYNADEIYIALGEIAVDTRDISDFFKYLKFYIREDMNWYKNKPFIKQILDELIKLNKLKDFFERIKDFDD